MNLLVAVVFEILDLDIPYELTSDGNNKPYYTQAHAYGLDKLLTSVYKTSESELSLNHLPEFQSTLYLTVMTILKYSLPKKLTQVPRDPPTNKDSQKQIFDGYRNQTRTSPPNLRCCSHRTPSYQTQTHCKHATNAHNPIPLAAATILTTTESVSLTKSTQKSGIKRWKNTQTRYQLTCAADSRKYTQLS